MPPWHSVLAASLFLDPSDVACETTRTRRNGSALSTGREKLAHQRERRSRTIKLRQRCDPDVATHCRAARGSEAPALSGRSSVCELAGTYSSRKTWTRLL
eukprot:3536367-Rhodomonas_salina.1